MAAIASRARTAFAITAAGAALVAGVLAKPRATAAPTRTALTSTILTAKLTSTQILAGEQDIAVTIKMPDATDRRRPPLSIVVVLDRSGSMHGEPLANAKRAAATLIDTLAADDAFAIVTFSDKDEVVAAMGRASAAHKAEAIAEIGGITDDGGTCTSCGITRGTAEFARSPISGGVRRMVLISDGQANEGLWDHDELVDLAAQTARGGVSISTVGVGLDFDEQTLIRLGESGRGHYYFAKDTAQLAGLFATELGSVRATVATNVALAVDVEPGTTIDDAYGYPLQHVGRQVLVPIADLRAGETRKVVFHAHVTARDLATFRLSWSDPRNGARDRALTTATTLATTLTTDPAAVSATRDAEATAAVEEARTAKTIDQATATFEQYGAEAAQRVITRQLAHVRDRVEPVRFEVIERAATAASQGFSLESSDEAKKLARTTAYELTR